jgi:hypothetical protein
VLGCDDSVAGALLGAGTTKANLDHVRLLVMGTASLLGRGQNWHVGIAIETGHQLAWSKVPAGNGLHYGPSGRPQ